MKKGIAKIVAWAAILWGTVAIAVYLGVSGVGFDAQPVIGPGAVEELKTVEGPLGDPGPKEEGAIGPDGNEPEPPKPPAGPAADLPEPDGEGPAGGPADKPAPPHEGPGAYKPGPAGEKPDPKADAPEPGADAPAPPVPPHEAADELPLPHEGAAATAPPEALPEENVTGPADVSRV